MTLTMLVKTFFEFAAIVLLIVGLINEKKVIAFEDKFFKALRYHIRRRLRRAASSAAKVQNTRVNNENGNVSNEAGMTVISGKKSTSRVA